MSLLESITKTNKYKTYQSTKLSNCQSTIQGSVGCLTKLGKNYYVFGNICRVMTITLQIFIPYFSAPVIPAKNTLNAKNTINAKNNRIRDIILLYHILILGLLTIKLI